jgi:hypothetical protein
MEEIGSGRMTDHALDLYGDATATRQMGTRWAQRRSPSGKVQPKWSRLKRAGIEWEGWHGFRRGLATNLERIGIRESITAMILRHANDRVTRKHYIKPPTLEAIAAREAPVREFFVAPKAGFAPRLFPRAFETEPGHHNGEMATVKTTRDVTVYD